MGRQVKKMGNINDRIYSAVYETFDRLEGNHFAVLGKPEAPMWERPLLGVAAGDDAYYDFLKEHIGSFHWSPAEVFSLKYGDTPDSGKLRVLSIIFPQTKETKAMQSKAYVFPCDNWVVSRGEWEPLMQEFAMKLEAALETMGVRAAAIDLRPEFSRMESETLGIASKWSHRHSAFAAGLGTFGLSDGFISEKGMAIRMTSIIVEADLKVTPRGERGHYDWCLYYRSGICGACIRRCPIRAISEKGHDKIACFGYEEEACAKYWPEHIMRGDYVFGCGICQSKVPCMDKRP